MTRHSADDAKAATESLQIVPRPVSVSKYVSPTSRRTAIKIGFTGGNTKGIRAVEDSCCGFARIDTAGYGFDLSWNDTSKVWYARAALTAPADTTARKAFSLYFKSNTPGVADTVFARGQILDQARPPLRSVDQWAIIDQAVKPSAVDSTAQFSLLRLRADKVYLPQVSGSNAAIRIPEGTASSSGKAIEITGSGGSTNGTALAVTGWAGPALQITRVAGVTTPNANAIDVSMAAEADTGSLQYGAAIDWSGPGKVSGISLTRTSGARAFSSYGLRLVTSSGASVSAGATEYGIYVDQGAAASGTSRNVAIYADGDTANSGRALKIVGDSEFGTGATGDSLLVNQPATFTESVTVPDASFTVGKLSQTGATSGQVVKWNGSAWAPATDATGGGGGGHTIRDDGVDMTSRGNLNFVATGTIATTLNDDSGDDETEVVLTVPTGGIGATEIAADAVGTSELADSSVASANILSNTVIERCIGTSAVGTQQIAASSVTNAKMADDAIDRAELATDAVGSGELDMGEFIDAWRKRPFWFDDFINAGTTMSGNDPWSRNAVVSGTCGSKAGTGNHPGILQLSSAVGANSGITMNLGANVLGFLIAGGETFEAAAYFPTLTNCNNFIGFSDASGGEATDGCYFSISGTTATGKTSSNSSRTATGTTYTLSATTWYRFKIQVNAGATSVTFTIYDDSGTSLFSDTCASNIPTSAGRETGSTFSSIYTTGGAQEIAWIDWLATYYDGRSLTR